MIAGEFTGALRNVWYLFMLHPSPCSSERQARVAPRVRRRRRGKDARVRC